jgi:hypothetical protein
MLFFRRRKYVIVLSSVLLILGFVRLLQEEGTAWQPVYHPFDLPSSKEAVADSRVRPIAAQDAVSDDCVEQWIASGIWGSCQVEESKIDLIYTWVNVSPVCSNTHIGSHFALRARRYRQTCP